MMDISQYQALLFDMDGTLLTSIKAAERVWSAWALAHGLDPVVFLPTIHGVQTVETIRRLALPGVDPVQEAVAITRAEIEDVDGVEAIAGVLQYLSGLPVPWAVVTSAPRELAVRRMAAAGIPMPPLLIAAEDVEHGKPAPDCFLLAAQKLGVEPSRCLVFEDSEAGIRAAEQAGCDVVIISATHRHALDTLHRVARDYTELNCA